MLKCGKDKFHSLYKTTFAVIAVILMGGLFFTPVTSYAQGGELPCGGNDPTDSNPCPLDTWVWVLVAAALIFGAVYLQRQQKLQKQA